MNPLVALIAPLALLLPAPVVVEGARAAGEPVATKADPQMARPQGPMSLPDPFEGGPWDAMAQTFQPGSQMQVRIEQTLSIRVAPRPPSSQPLMLADLPRNGVPSRMSERRMGRCVTMSGIAGMQYGGDRRLILFLRDSRIVSATLEKACRAREFYSGFYVARNGDGMICQDRDQLQSRSGANCKIDGFRQLVANDD